MKKILVVTILSFIFLSGYGQKPIYKTIKSEVLEDKVKGAWVGKMFGVEYGIKMEFAAMGHTYEDEIPWEPSMIKGALRQDDLYGQINFMSTMEKHGLHVPVRILAENFANAEFGLCHANQQARKNFWDGIMPPMTGHAMYNSHADDIDFQIESDFIGIMNPGMPQNSNRMCDSIGRIMAYGDGLYGGMFIAGMYTQAFFENDIRKVIDNALNMIPYESTYAECIRDAIAGYEEYPNDWRKTWRLLEDKWGTNDFCIPFAAFNIDAKINGAYIVMGLLYGGMNIEKTMEVAIRCGQDTDCNSSNAAGILGTIYGFSAIPSHLTSYLNEIEDEFFLHTDYSFKKTMSQTMAFIKQNVTENGGKVNKKSYKIKIQEPVFTGKLEQSFPGYKMNYYTLITDREHGWNFNGYWHHFMFNNIDGIFKESFMPNSFLELDFEGTGIVLLGGWMPDGGCADIYLDGVFVQEMDMYYFEEVGNGYGNRVVVFHKIGLENKKHTLKLVVKDKRNLKSTGNKIRVERAIIYTNNDIKTKDIVLYNKNQTNEM